MRLIRNGVLAVMLSLGTTACLDLTVVNQNNPDIQRALRDPVDVEQVIVSAFNIGYNGTDASDVVQVYPALADETTATSTTRSFHWASEPRQPLDNDPNGNQVWIPRSTWDAYASCVANTNDGLKPIEGVNPDFTPRAEGPMRIVTPNAAGDSVNDNTDRAFVFAKMMQGWCLGFLAIPHDQVATATEDTIIPSGFDDLQEWEATHLKDYKANLAMAIASLEEGIARATTGAPFILPVTWINGQQYNNQQLAQLMHTMIARFLVLTPRTPAERAAVDWQKVLFHTERGLTYDFGPVMLSGTITSGSYIANFVSTGNGELRADNLYIGPADQSGRFQAWLAAADDQKMPFMVITPDRRVSGVPTSACTAALQASSPIGGNTACSPTGAYFRNRNSTSIYTVARGVKYQAYHGFYRRANSAYGGFNSSTGQHVIANADENRLLRAEALLRTNQVQAAIDLINVSRTRGVRIANTTIATNLPAIPATTSATTRLPLVNNTCVPRRKDGTCGDVWDALIWERKMETMGFDPLLYWSYARGVAGLLQPGTLVQMPVPGRYLVQLKIPVYTYGGVGGNGAAQ
jgi:hypothetical protein